MRFTHNLVWVWVILSIESIHTELAELCDPLNTILEHLYNPAWVFPESEEDNSLIKNTSFTWLNEAKMSIRRIDFADADPIQFTKVEKILDVLDVMENVSLKHADIYNGVLAKCAAFKCYQNVWWYMLPYDPKLKKEECEESGFKVCALPLPDGIKKYKHLKRLIEFMIRKSYFGQSFWHQRIVSSGGRYKTDSVISRWHKTIERELKYQLKHTRGKLKVTNLKRVKETVEAFVNDIHEILELFESSEKSLIKCIRLIHAYLNEFGTNCDDCIEADAFCTNDFCPPIKSGKNCKESIQGSSECLMVGQKENARYDQLYTVKTFDGEKKTHLDKSFNRGKSAEFELLGPLGKPLIRVSLRGSWLSGHTSTKAHELTMYTLHSTHQQSFTRELEFMGSIIEDEGQRISVPRNRTIRSMLYLSRVEIYEREGNTHIAFPEYGLDISPMANQGLKIVLSKYWQNMTRGVCGNFDGKEMNDKDEN